MMVVYVVCAREDTGMIVGLLVNSMCVWGEDEKTTIRREFLTHEQALDWMKDRAREYAGRQDVDFLSRDGESRIVVPNARPQVRM